MIIDSQNNFTTEKVNIFNKLMIDTIKVKEDEFEFDGKHYLVCSDGICVQTLINDRILYRIFIEEGRNNSFVSNKLLKYL
ncbi:MAG: hypothetical protein H7Y18_18315 [Clostridiaceae bacterium]|nr:hypothetical protein [Clostridiaceae bacterium]